jgi:hypothetical protein
VRKLVCIDAAGAQMREHLPDDTLADRDVASETDDVFVFAHGFLQ